MIMYENVTRTDKPQFVSLQNVFYDVCPEHEIFDADSNCMFIDDDRYVFWRKEIPYKEYLQTHYWNLVRSVKLSLQNCCEICGKDKSLNVHHKSYENRGNELYHLNELVVLCRNCHKKFHEIGK